jgi:hypothetical protein
VTKTEATRCARAQLSHGHYVDGATVTYAFCPVCRERVDGEHMAWESRAPAVRAALVEHLVEEH